MKCQRMEQLETANHPSVHIWVCIGATEDLTCSCGCGTTSLPITGRMSKDRWNHAMCSDGVPKQEGDIWTVRRAVSRPWQMSLVTHGPSKLGTKIDATTSQLTVKAS